MKIAERIFRRKDYYITSPFGMRTDPFSKLQSFHDGVDYGTNLQNWNQYALEKGKVISCGLDTKFANAKYVWVEYPRLGIRLLHYHLNEIKVKKGQEVDENTIIGTTGKTGNATGIHLHLGMKYVDKLSNYVDAESYDYQPNIKIETTKRDINKHQVEITYDMMNARKEPNGALHGVFVPMGIYDILDETFANDIRWVQINEGVWCALLDECFIEYKPIEQPTHDCKALYEEIQKKLDAIKEIINDN